MSVLLDTNILLWWLADDGALPPPAREAIADPDTIVVVSAHHGDGTAGPGRSPEPPVGGEHGPADRVTRLN